MPMPTNQPLSVHYYPQTFVDISNPSSVYFAIAGRGRIKQIFITLNGAITLADSNVTFKVNGVVGTGSAVIAFTGSANGSSFVLTPSAGNSVNQGDIVEVISDGASTTTAVAACTLVVDERTAA